MRIAVAGGTGVVGRPIVEQLQHGGHDVVVLTRSNGVDLTAGNGLTDRLAGVDAVIDVSGPLTTSATESRAFFGAVTRNLLDAERAAGVGHHVALSIIGAAAVDAAYYAGKKVQEDLIMALDQRADRGVDHGVGWTIIRAGQFHEFAVQFAERGAVGPIVVAPSMRSQPIAAAEVAAATIEAALGEPQGLAPDLAGPREEEMAQLVRRYLRHRGSRRPVLPVQVPGAWGRSMRSGILLPGPGARLGTQTFDDWLRSTPA